MSAYASRYEACYVARGCRVSGKSRRRRRVVQVGRADQGWGLFGRGDRRCRLGRAFEGLLVDVEVAEYTGNCSAVPIVGPNS